MKRFKRAVSLLLTLLLLLSALPSIAQESVTTSPAPVHDPNDPTVITVAPFPYLTDVEKFQELATAMWKEIEPDVELAFVKWDCYTPELPTADVFMYDALFTDWLLEQGVMQPISAEAIDRKEDILPFALEGIYADDVLYGIPNLACAYHLIYYKDDEAIAAADNIVDLYDVISTRVTDTAKPADRNEALLFNRRDVSYYYMESLVDSLGDPSVLLELTNLTDPDALNAIVYMADMAGEALMGIPEELSDTIDLYDWFNNGFGRAFLGYSEALVCFDAIIDQLDIKLFSFSHQDNVPLYFMDVVSINSSVKDAGKVASCTKLLNLLSSEAFIEALLLNGESEPQFMMPVRQTVWDTLRGQHTLYEKLYSYIMQDHNVVSRYGSTVHDYLASIYGELSQVLESPY